MAGLLSLPRYDRQERIADELARSVATRIMEISMSRRPFVPTPEQVVEDAVANSRLSGYEVTEDVKAIMLRIARGKMTTEQVEVWECQQGNPKVAEGRGE